MKTIDHIPTNKLQRASKLVKTGAKVGVNYVKYYGEKVVNPSLSKEKLNESNAEDIYDGLKSLKGSALKVAQMLSMEKNIMPKAYVEKFSLSQFSVPPLSAPLVRKTFKKYLGKYPEDLFDTFEAQSVNAASIGQVHKAILDGKKLAVKIQYPGVADSISSDLALVKPIASRMFNLQGKGKEKYFKEVEDKLLEETDYTLELAQSMQMVEDCASIPNLQFPKYYEELSSERILTMDWMDGQHLSEFVATNNNQEASDQLSQALWDFYMFQMHRLRRVHADPHPGNFLVNDKNQLIAIDFGCIKHVPEDFYIPYFELAEKENINNPEIFKQKLFELEILREDDTPDQVKFFSELFHEMLSLFTEPFHQETFDFKDTTFFDKIAALSEKYSKDTEIRKMNGNRGSKHFLYINRTFFGLYNLMHDLGGRIKVNNFEQYAYKKRVA
ncbi:ABC transporter [Dokdonia pacifica]|uniref:ABC1 family protein n=1 Tax=Dokdonia pacifica TaxID=1627892 RepID=A0A238ZID7_9FLAO|nr:AarF/UbiB family protein [Dokdonia pacifica]GGG06779.1 ABC transporter [Dokdonia pacifica]SNR83236.1 ABC1 family protein [Dokdonia pacifica]